MARQCQRPGCTQLVTHSAARFCGESCKTADKADKMREQRARAEATERARFLRVCEQLLRRKPELLHELGCSCGYHPQPKRGRPKKLAG